ncbi:hypothetical protein BBJ28_00018036 [Nothophytophthora sp. Chile5]|nr:hypothetical protein BBJ28_00018036 [Nothophytophthora sp. Chile5]
MPLSRFLFLDCDALRDAVLSHMQERPSEFVIDRSSVAFPLDPLKLTVLLSGTDSVVKSRCGVYFSLGTDDVTGFTNAGWDLRKKSALEHNTVEKLMHSNLTTSGGWTSNADRKTLALATGYFTPAIVACLEAHLLANWCVRLYCFRTAVSVEICDRLRASNRTGFQSIYLDRFLKDLLIGDHSYVATPSVTEATGDFGGSQSSKRSAMPLQAGGRFVFMDMDDVFKILLQNKSLHLKFPGSTSSRNLRINLRALTDRTCGTDQSMVQRQVATYGITTGLAGPLANLRWETRKQPTPNMAAALLELLAKLISSPPVAADKTLVLVMGDDNLAASVKASVTGLLSLLIAQLWHVEVHAWMDSLGGVFAELQAAHPASVVIKPLDEALMELVYLKSTEMVSRAVSAASSDLVEAKVDSAVATPTPETSLLLRQMKEMQDAFVGLQASVLAPTRLQQEKDELEQRLRQQEEELFCLREEQAACEAERKLLEDQATEAHLKHRLGLQDREEMLTCPITQCLYETPVVTSCCGKTFSEAALDGLQGPGRSCPWCRREEGFTTHLNRDMAELVEQFTAECEALEGAGYW